jgi:hypothetical protein
VEAKLNEEAFQKCIETIYIKTNDERNYIRWAYFSEENKI